MSLNMGLDKVDRAYKKRVNFPANPLFLYDFYSMYFTGILSVYFLYDFIDYYSIMKLFPTDVFSLLFAALAKVTCIVLV